MRSIPILMYHSINDDNNPLSVSKLNFEKQMFFLSKNKFDTIKFEDLDYNIGKKKIIITFDDGYKNLIDNALPILKKYNFTAVCFFVSNHIGQYNFWDENKKNFSKLNLMNLDDIKYWLNNKMLIGSHTSDHFNLKKINLDEKLNQISQPKLFFKKNFQIEIDYFSYPFGQYDNDSLNIVKKYYKYAVTTKRSRYKENKFNTFELPRVSVNKNDGMFKFFLKIKTIYEDIKFNEN